MAYSIHLDNFEGPLDLLLYFIQRDKIDIYDIPIAHITKEYLDYLNIIEAFNLAVAGEFVMLAATLMRIKVRMLLPQRPVEGEELIEDPRKELVDQLLAYQQFRQAGDDLANLHELRSVHFTVAGTDLDPGNGAAPGDYLSDVTLFDLMGVFQQVLGRMPSTEPIQIRAEPIRLDDQIRHIRHVLARQRQITFKDLLLEVADIKSLVVTFLAVLELMRRQAIIVEQSGAFGEITIREVVAEA